MEFLMDPSIRIGLLTLVVLEIVLAQHERMPTVGESFRFGEFRFDVLEISNRRVELVRISQR